MFVIKRVEVFCKTLEMGCSVCDCSRVFPPSARLLPVITEAGGAARVKVS